MFCMRFANLKKFHKALCTAHQIKGQYELLCLNYLESELTTKLQWYIPIPEGRTMVPKGRIKGEGKTPAEKT